MEQKLIRIKKQFWKKFNLHHMMYESTRQSYIVMLSRKLMKSENWLWRQKLFRKKNWSFSFIFIIGRMTHSEKATSSCYLGKYWFLRLDTTEKRCLDSKKQLKYFFLPQKRMSHPEKFTLPCYLANYRFLRIVYGTKIV